MLSEIITAIILLNVPINDGFDALAKRVNFLNVAI